MQDLIVLAIVTIFVFVLSYFFNVFIFLIRIFQQHPSAITWVDEIITVLLTLSIGLAIIAWRRWKALQKETARRIRLQERLISEANTKADIERIIAHQLRTEIQMHKQSSPAPRKDRKK